MTTDRYTTRRGIHVHRTVEAIPVKDAIEPVIDALDSRRGILLASSYEYPGRYTRWDMGFVDPPLVLVARGRGLRVETLNARGAVLLPVLALAGIRLLGGRHAGRIGRAMLVASIGAFLIGMALGLTTRSGVSGLPAGWAGVLGLAGASANIASEAAFTRATFAMYGKSTNSGRSPNCTPFSTRMF